MWKTLYSAQRCRGYSEFDLTNGQVVNLLAEVKLLGQDLFYSLSREIWQRARDQWSDQMNLRREELAGQQTGVAVGPHWGHGSRGGSADEADEPPSPAMRRRRPSGGSRWSVSRAKVSTRRSSEGPAAQQGLSFSHSSILPRLAFHLLVVWHCQQRWFKGQLLQLSPHPLAYCTETRVASPLTSLLAVFFVRLSFLSCQEVDNYS